MSYLVAFAGLFALILLHECGHFFAALAVGIRPRRYSIFLGPAIVKAKHRGIEYAIGSIPIGGYVKIPGMHRPAASDVDMYFGPAVDERPQLFAATTALRSQLESGEFSGAARELDRVEDGADEAGLTRRPRRLLERGVGELRDGLGADAYWRQRTWKRILVIFAGPAVNFLVAIALFTTVFTMGYGKVGTTILRIQHGEPAADSGLRVGDTITAVDDVPVTPGTLRQQIAASGGQPLYFSLDRGGKRVRVGPIRARRIGNAYRVGIELGAKTSVAEALASSVSLSGDYVRGVVHVFSHKFISKGRKQLTGPVGIVRASSEAYNTGTPDYLWVLGLISLSLAILNLLPLMPLDGGHILFSLIEGIRGRAVGREIYERVSAVGITFVAIFILIALSNDIGRVH